MATLNPYHNFVTDLLMFQQRAEGLQSHVQQVSLQKLCQVLACRFHNKWTDKAKLCTLEKLFDDIKMPAVLSSSLRQIFLTKVCSTKLEKPSTA